jgi:hypothetical protein
VINIFILLLFLQAILAGVALPFYGSVPLSTAVYEAWTFDPFNSSWGGGAIGMALPFGLVGLVFTLGMRFFHDSRWRLCSLALPVFVLPILLAMFMPHVSLFKSIQGILRFPTETIRETIEMFQSDQDGEWWEIFPILVSGWWFLFALIICPVEFLLIARRDRTSDGRGFAPILDKSKSSP